MFLYSVGRFFLFPSLPKHIEGARVFILACIGAGLISPLFGVPNGLVVGLLPLRSYDTMAEVFLTAFCISFLLSGMFAVLAHNFRKPEIERGDFRKTIRAFPANFFHFFVCNSIALIVMRSVFI
jgi:hypothetical protein